MLVKIKGIHKVKRVLADGTQRVYYYAWRGGPAMTKKPWEDGFSEEHARLKASVSSQDTNTLEGLIDHFTGPENARNPDFLALAESTRRDHLYAFQIIRAQWPRLPIALTQQKGMKAEIREWHRSYATNPRKADKLLFSLSKVFSYAIQDELITRNPCEGITRLYSGSRRDSVWTDELVAAFRANAPQHLLLPFEMAICTGQRQGDILSAPWSAYDGTYLRFLQSKGKKRIRVRVHSRLKTMLDALPRDTLRICTNSRGRPWTKDGFKTSWGKELARLEIGGVTFHDLRGTFITERAREGSSVAAIARISGHSNAEVRSVMEKHYLAEDQEAADAVILRMERNP